MGTQRERIFNRSHDRAKSLSDALQVLNEAAHDSADEVRGMLKKDFHDLQQLFGDIGPELEESYADLRDSTAEAFNEARERTIKRARAVATRIDGNVHENAWTYVGGAAAMAAIAGYMLGRRSQEH